MLEILDKNWPGILTEYNTEDVISLLHNPSDEEIDLARKKGVTFGATEVNGRAIINPGLGVVTSGSNIHVVKRANEIIRFLQESLMQIDDNYEEIKKELSDRVGSEIKELDIRIHRQNSWPFFMCMKKILTTLLQELMSNLHKVLLGDCTIIS